MVLPQKYREGILRAQWLCGLEWGLLNLNFGVFRVHDAGEGLMGLPPPHAAGLDLAWGNATCIY